MGRSIGAIGLRAYHGSRFNAILRKKGLPV
jgi:hypothetical protein